MTYVFNFGNPMLEHTVKNVPKRVFDELQLLEADSNTAEGSFERTKKYLNGKIESGELECETFFGGSGPNIVSVLAKAGVPSALFAGIGGELGLPDEIGDGIISDLSDYGVVRCLKRVEGYKSCEIFTLLHDWNEDRTFAVDLGATVALEPADIPVSLLEQSSHVVLTQYKIADSPEVTWAIVEQARKINDNDPDLGNIVTDFSSEYHLDIGAELLNQILKKRVYMILANVEEMRHKHDLDIYNDTQHRIEAAKILLADCEVAVLKLADKGAMIADHSGHYTAKAIPPNPLTNLNGAGDALAAGVLEYLTFEQDPVKAIQLGVRRAWEAIGSLGPKTYPNSRQFKEVNNGRYGSMIPW